MRPRVAMLAATAMAVLALTWIPASATAAPAATRLTDDFTLDDPVYLCDLEMDYTLAFKARTTIVPHGRDGTEYWSVFGTAAESFTYDDVTVTAFARVLEKDLRVTSNPDGTLTILEIASGNATLYGPDGKAIARDPGQLRYLLEVDENGNVTFGSVVRDSTGRSDDFCAALRTALLGAG